MRRLRVRRSQLPAAVLLLVLVAFLWQGDLPVLQNAWFDLYQRLRPRADAAAPVVVVAVDEPTLARLGQWPWPRTLAARLVERIAADRPAVVALDLLFPEPDRFPGGGDEQLGRALGAVPSVVVLAGRDDLPGRTPASGRLTPSLVRGGEALPFVRRHAVALRSRPEIDGAASGHALLSVYVDRGVVRRVPLVGAIGDALVPGLALEAVRVASRAQAFVTEVGARGIAAVRAGDLRVPAQPDGSLWLHFRRHDPSRFVSAADVLEGRTPPGTFADRHVLVGVTGLALVDQHATPVGERMPGVEIHAQALENLLRGALLSRPLWAETAEIATLLVGGALLVVATSALGVLGSALLGLGLGAAVLAAGMALFATAGLVLDGATPVVGLALVYTAALTGTLAEANAARRELQQRLQAEREAAAHVAGELAAAQRVQMGLLPRAEAAFPGERRFEIHAAMEPARVVGGDLYDFFRLDRDRLLFALGDVSGHGLPASLFMVVTKALAKSISSRSPAGLTETVRELDVEIGRENPESFFVTMVAGVLDLETGRVEYCIAGHDAPWLLDPAAGAVTRLGGEAGPPLCVLDGFPYVTFEHRLAPGQALCIVSDGVTEARSPGGELFGSHGVTATLASLLAAPEGPEPRGIVAAVLGAIRAFTGGAEAADDVTVLAVRWRGPTSPAMTEPPRHDTAGSSRAPATA